MIVGFMATAAVVLMIALLPKHRAFLWAVIVIYVIGVLYFSLFSRTPVEGGQGFNLIPGGFLRVAKTRFKAYGVYGILRSLGGLYLNILMFVPFGFLVLTIRPGCATWKIILAGFCFSLLIEMTQLTTNLGIFEMDDLINNSLGTWIGTVVYSKRMRTSNQYSEKDAETDGN